MTDAKAHWERRIYRRVTETSGADPVSELPATTGLSAEPANGFVLLSWDAVPDAAGYVIERGALGAADGEREIVSHGGSDVPAVVGTAFADTGVDDRTTYSYRVGAVLGNEYPVWHWSEAVEATTTGTAGGEVAVHVDAAGDAGQLDRVWWLVGSERLTQLGFGDLGNGHHIGDEFAEALTIAHRDLGVTGVRAHAILHDDNQVVTRGDDGSLAFDFTIVDELYDQILAIGIHPLVELGFMPACIARNPGETVFEYRGIISPPADWAEWRQTVAALAAHLVERYGIDEVATWGFEVWNEPNLEVFWTGSQDDYLRLYEEAARAIKEVDERLTVGGPSTAASEWVEALAAYAEKHALPLELATTHTYGNYPLDFRPVLERHGFADADILWTEWGVGSTHFGPIHDGVSGAPFVLSGFRSAQHRMKALSYWVVSDHFEELGRPPALFHDGFGLLTLGNLRKPRYWAVHLAAQMGDQVLPAEVSGDGADVLVQAWASRHDDGTVDVLVWNNTVNSQVMHGDERLLREVTVTLDGLPAERYAVQLARVDEQHSNIKAASSGADWPDQDEWARLHEADQLHTDEADDLVPTSGSGSVSLTLPQPGVVRIRLSADGQPSADDEETTR
ncbi:MAG: GH39 family glycosyl hydrolase [Nocardioides sp.]